MLRAIKCYRSLRRLPLESYSSRVKFSSYDDDYEYNRRDPALDASNDWQPGGSRNGNDFSNIIFDEVFHVPRYEDIHDIQEGGYVDISPDELDRLLPEGLAGEMDVEFDSAERMSWMVRDSTKLLCRIMEEFENTSKRNRGEFEFTPKRVGVASPVHLPGLTDRKEWPDATLKAFYYGAELNPGYVRKIFAEDDGSEAASPDGTEKTDAKVDEVAASAAAAVEANTGNTSRVLEAPPTKLYTVRGEGSQVEEFIKTLQADGKVIPDRIMLTGDRGVGKSCTLNQAVMWARERGWICLFIPRESQGLAYLWYDPMELLGHTISMPNPKTLQIEEGDVRVSATMKMKVWELAYSEYNSSMTLRNVWGGEYIEPLPYDRPLIDDDDLAREERLMDTYEDNNRSFYDVEQSIPRADGTIYDNPSQSAIVLRGLWWAHGELLRDCPIQFPERLNKYFSALDSFGEAYDRVKSLQGREKMSFIEVRQVIEDDEVDEDSEEIDDMILRHFKYDSSFRPTNLEELIMTGIAFHELAGPIFMDIVAELRALDLPDHPVLFAVDEFNYWESPSSFRYRQKAVQASEICVPSVLKFASLKKADSENYSLKNGICIGATSAKHPIKKLVTYEDYKSSIPLVIRVPCYSQVELASVVSYYQRENLIDPGFKTQDIVAYRMQSGSNGRLARLECCSFFFPLAVAKSAESGEDTTFKYMDTYTHVSDRPRGGDDDDEEEEEETATNHSVSKRKFSKK